MARMGAHQAVLRPNDEIWLYGTPSGRWENMAGRQGVVLVRNARVVKEFVGIRPEAG
jgi:hypothetical protein